MGAMGNLVGICFFESHYYDSPESTTYFGIHLRVQKMSLVPLKLTQVDFHHPLKTSSWGYDQCFILADASAGVDRADEQTVAMVTPQKLVANVSIGSKYGIFTRICHKNQLNVGTYTIHEGYGVARWVMFIPI